MRTALSLALLAPDTTLRTVDQNGITGLQGPVRQFLIIGLEIVEKMNGIIDSNRIHPVNTRLLTPGAATGS